MIVLENEGFDSTFGANTEAPHLEQTLAAQGQRLTEYYGIGHFSPRIYMAMISAAAWRTWPTISIGDSIGEQGSLAKSRGVAVAQKMSYMK